jgi:hypothetical protein
LENQVKTRNVTLKIPHWIPTRHQWTEWKKKVKLFFFPYRCNGCNNKLPTKYPQYYTYRAGNHMGSISHGQFAINCFGTQFCAGCLKEYIHQLDLPTENCDLCDNKNTKVIGYHYNKGVIITFLWHWWNGRNYCLTCVDDLLDNAKTKARNGY